MARGRMINQTIAKDKRLNDLSLEAELVYLMTIPHLDRDGLILGEGAVLWGTVCPRRPELLAQMDAIIAEWVDAGLVISYECDDGAVLWFTGFVKNQGGLRYDRETPSGFPPPPGYGRSSSGLVPLSNKPTKDERRGDAGEGPERVRRNAGGMPEAAGSGPAEVKHKQELQHPPTPLTEPEPEVEAAGAAAGVVFALWENNMPGTMTPIIADQIKDWIATFGAGEVQDAISVAVKNNRRHANYVDGVLRRRAAGNDPPRGPAVAQGTWQELNQQAPTY